MCLPGPFLDVVLAAALLVAGGKHDALVKDVVAGKKIVTIARHDAPDAGESSRAVRLEADRVRGTKYFVPFAAVFPPT